MPTIQQGNLTIASADSQVTIGTAASGSNRIVLTIKNNGTDATVSVTVTCKCGQDADSNALLASPNDLVTAQYSIAGGSPLDLTKSVASGPPAQVSWLTSQFGDLLSAGATLVITLSNFAANTPPGSADIDVQAQISPDGQGDDWTPALVPPFGGNNTLEVTKAAPATALISYFTATPDFILEAGSDPVVLNFFATAGFAQLKLYRNNRWISTWPAKGQPVSADGSITGTITEKPSITSVYRLVGTPSSGAEQSLTQIVQVVSPGWNQIALPQGYPTQLFVNPDLGGGSAVKLYGIFIHTGGGAALYSSATGVDDWAFESGKIPTWQDASFNRFSMANSPGVAWGGKLWLIGGSSFDLNSATAEVWCYGKDENGVSWQPKTSVPLPLACHSCVALDDGILVLGGIQGGTPSNQLWKLTEDSAGHITWTKLQNAEPPTASKGLPYSLTAAAGPPPVISPVGTDPFVTLYGGLIAGKPQTDFLYCGSDFTWQAAGQIVPPPGAPLGAALVSFLDPKTSTPRLILLGTFLLPNPDPDPTSISNRSVSLMFEWQFQNDRWEESPVFNGWERFKGDLFYMQAVAFNQLLIVWSLSVDLDPSAPPKLNVLVS